MQPLIGIATSALRMIGNLYLPDVYANAVRKGSGRFMLLPPGETDPGFILDGKLGTSGDAHP